jgi:hypothetical protein
MISGIAGSNMVSPYIAIKSAEPKIASDIQAFLGTFWFKGGDDGCLLLLPFCVSVISKSNRLNMLHLYFFLMYRD